MSTMRVCARRSGALRLQLRSRPSAECSEYVGEVRPFDNLWLVHPKWGSAEWDDDGFALVATLTGPPARGYVRMSDIAVEWGGCHYFGLSDAVWFDRHWFASADRCDVCVYDATPAPVEELPPDLADAPCGLNIPGAVRNGMSESGWTYVALRLGWPQAGHDGGRVEVERACHSTIGYLARMDDSDRQVLHRKLNRCLRDYVVTEPIERPYDDAILYARRWRLRDEDWREGDADTYTVSRLANVPRHRFERMLSQHHVQDSVISDVEEHDDKVRSLYERDSDRAAAAKIRSRLVPPHDGFFKIAQAEFECRGKRYFALDRQECPELDDLLHYLSDVAYYWRSGQITYRADSGILKTRPPVCIKPDRWHVSKPGAWCCRVE